MAKPNFEYYSLKTASLESVITTYARTFTWEHVCQFLWHTGAAILEV
jgi:hypothetical protein